MKLNEVHPRLFLRGHTLSLGSGHCFRVLLDSQVKFVMNVAPKPDLHLASLARGVGIEYHHEPLSDGQTVDGPRIERLAGMVAEAMTWTKCLVHCRAGRNRSALVAIMAIAEHDWRRPGDVLDDMRRLRPTVLANEAFEEWVRAHPWNGR